MRRHPYTYADDFVRHLAGYNENGTVLSRSEASLIIAGIASVIGMTHEQLAEKLSLYYQANAEEIAEKALKQFISLKVGQND